ncbi:hypothetical protein [Flexithrix dorotheae]|uniref:hypothetical protein n=1 Tax=Flexithrix dorotheae TaxID=70993 RepID=UPI00037E0BB8|nr:hypothetical protein [Flexithrix dorotheae]
MAAITTKKPVYPISASLRRFLVNHHREIEVPITYSDLFHYTSSINLEDKNGNDTYWETVFYSQADNEHIQACLKQVYALMKADGDTSIMDHLYIDRVDLCMYGNTKPFRVRIVNKLNDLFDYFYIKQADASRIYGLELEHLLSPNKINYLVKGNTLLEEHIPGIPGDSFVKHYVIPQKVNARRLAKEFVKFNERCLVQLLGDIRGDNFVVEIIPDFDEVYYRMRAIDFDQQAYDGRKSIYMPQFFKENYPIIDLGLKNMKPEVELQYQKEERSRIANRIRTSELQLNALVKTMSNDRISTEENVDQLKYELAELYNDSEFIACRNMGEILNSSLRMIMKKPVRSVGKVTFNM